MGTANAGTVLAKESLLSAASTAMENSASPPLGSATDTGIAAPADPFFIPPPELPTQVGPLGARFDFNDGARVWLPLELWHVEIHDAESGNVILACDAGEGWVVSTKKYYVPFQVVIWERGKPEALVDHVLDLKDKPVLSKFPVWGTLGDLIGWFPYAEKFYGRLPVASPAFMYVTRMLAVSHLCAAYCGEHERRLPERDCLQAFSAMSEEEHRPAKLAVSLAAALKEETAAEATMSHLPLLERKERILAAFPD